MSNIDNFKYPEMNSNITKYKLLIFINNIFFELIITIIFSTILIKHLYMMINIHIMHLNYYKYEHN